MPRSHFPHMAVKGDSEVILWRRWTDGEVWIGGFYRACAIFPLDTFREPSIDEPEIKIIDGYLRFSFRHTPIVTLILATLLMVSSPGFFDLIIEIRHISDFGLLFGVIFFILLWVFILFWMVFRVRIVEDLRYFIWIIITSFTTALLIAGSALAIFLSYSTRPGNIVGPRLVYDSGALLFFILFGFLAYDTTLRTENFISNYPETDSLVNTTGYDERLSKLEDDLQNEIFSAPVSHVFALVIQIPYIPFLYGGGNLSLINLTYVIINFHLLVFLFQFFIVSKFLISLVRENRQNNSEWQILYRPFHPDRRAGFRDFGRFGFHIGVVLILVGLMFLYFLHVQGRFTSVPDQIGFAWLYWVTAFIVPTFLYTIIFHTFTYYYFISLHKHMAEMRYDLIQGIESNLRNEAKESDAPSAYSDREFITYIVNSPIWPISVWKLRLLYIVSLIPAFLSLPMLIGWGDFFDLIGLLPFF